MHNGKSTFTIQIIFGYRNILLIASEFGVNKKRAFIQPVLY